MNEIFDLEEINNILEIDANKERNIKDHMKRKNYRYLMSSLPHRLLKQDRQMDFQYANSTYFIDSERIKCKVKLSEI